MKLKKEYAVLAVVIVALGLYLFFHERDRTTYTLPDPAALTSQDVTKIEIDRGDESTVVLNRKDDGWTVSPGDYPADAGLVDRMLKALQSLEVTALVSETENYGRYELGAAQGLQVTAYADGRVVRAFRIGKAADTMRHTHIVLNEDPNVYHARGNFRNDFDQSVANLRDKTVLRFQSDAVKAFSVETGDERLTVERAPAAEADESEDVPATDEAEKTGPPQWRTADGQPVADETVDRFLEALSGLKCRAYLTDRTKDELEDPTYRIEIESDTTSRLTVFAPADENATEVPATSSLREDPFTLADFDLDPIASFLAALEDGEASSTP